MTSDEQEQTNDNETDGNTEAPSSETNDDLQPEDEETDEIPDTNTSGESEFCKWFPFLCR